MEFTLYILSFFSYAASKGLSISVRNLFINSMHGNDWKQAKSAVICLDIKDDFGSKSRIVIHNCQESDEHSEEVLKRIMIDNIKDPWMINYLKSCTFTMYMNWSPCGMADRNCVECLFQVFQWSKSKCSLFFVSLYTKVDDVILSLSKLGRLSTYSCIAFMGFMKETEYSSLGIPVFNIDAKILQNKQYAIHKCQNADQFEAEIILNEF